MGLEVIPKAAVNCVEEFAFSVNSGVDVTSSSINITSSVVVLPERSLELSIFAIFCRICCTCDIFGDSVVDNEDENGSKSAQYS